MRILPYILSSLVCVLFVSLLHGQQGHRIEAEVKGFDQDQAFLAYYFGDKTYIKDTTTASGGKFVFEGAESLDPGIYLVVLPPSNNYFEIVIDKDQVFSLKTDTADFVGAMQINGSLENQVFYEDLKFINAQRVKAEEIQQQIKAAEGKKKSALESELTKVNEAVMGKRQKMIADHPDMLYSALLKAMEDPQVPDPPAGMSEEDQKTFAFRYYRAHYFDQIDLSDARLLRTPVLHQRVMNYIERLTYQEPDSINVAIDEVIDRSRGDDEAFQYWVITLLNKYAKSKIMGMDAVYVHMVEKYYLSGEATWADPESIEKMEERALALSPNLIGRVAPNFSVWKTDGSRLGMHDVNADWLILYFWDYDCGHCKKVTPKLAEAFTPYAGYKVRLLTVSINGDEATWKEKLDEYGLNQKGAINTQDHLRQGGFTNLYDIRSTPRLFLIDKDKKIFAKQISVEQLQDILNRKLGLEAEKEDPQKAKG